MKLKLIIAILSIGLCSSGVSASQLKLLVSIESQPFTTIVASPKITEETGSASELPSLKQDNVWIAELKMDEGEILKPVSIKLLGNIPDGYSVVGVSLIQPFYESGEHDILLAPILPSTSASTIRELYATNPSDLQLDSLFIFYQRARYAAVQRVKSEPIGGEIKVRTIRAAFKFLQATAELSKRRNLAPGNDENTVVSWLKHAITNSPSKVSDALPRISDAEEMVSIIEKSMGHRMNTLWNKIIELPNCEERIQLFRSYKEKLDSYPNYERSKIVEVTRVTGVVVEESIAQCLANVYLNTDVAKLSWFSPEIDSNIIELEAHIDNKDLGDAKVAKLKRDLEAIQAIKVSLKL